MRTWVALAAVVLAGACNKSVVPPKAAAALDCPAAYDLADGWAPASGAPADRLVPAVAPSTAVVCRYAPGGDRLDGQVTLAAGTERIADDLTVPPRLPRQSRACTLIGGTNVPYLLGLRVGDSTVWVATRTDPNSCEPATNGRFTTPAYLGQTFAGAYDGARWPAATAGKQTCATIGRTTGRLGQESALVPGQPAALHACVTSADGTEETTTPADRTDAMTEVRDLLSRLTTAPSQSGCQGPSKRLLTLSFSYANGPDVVVRVIESCDPAVDNGSLQAAATAAQQQQLVALVTGGS